MEGNYQNLKQILNINVAKDKLRMGRCVNLVIV